MKSRRQRPFGVWITKAPLYKELVTPKGPMSPILEIIWYYWGFGYQYYSVEVVSHTLETVASLASTCVQGMLLLYYGTF